MMACALDQVPNLIQKCEVKDVLEALLRSTGAIALLLGVMLGRRSADARPLVSTLEYQ